MNIKLQKSTEFSFCDVTKTTHSYKPTYPAYMQLNWVFLMMLTQMQSTQSRFNTTHSSQMQEAKSKNVAEKGKTNKKQSQTRARETATKTGTRLVSSQSSVYFTLRVS